MQRRKAGWSSPPEHPPPPGKTTTCGRVNEDPFPFQVTNIMVPFPSTEVKANIELITHDITLTVMYCGVSCQWTSRKRHFSSVLFIINEAAHQTKYNCNVQRLGLIQINYFLMRKLVSVDESRIEPKQLLFCDVDSLCGFQAGDGC